MMKKRKIKIAPSLLAADFACLESEVKRAERAGSDMLHVDVMDGHFVKNITLGPFIVKAIHRIASVPIVSHLMIEKPEKYVKEFAKVGSDMIIFHIETTQNPKALIKLIKGLKKKVGVSLKPKTKARSIKSILPLVDEVLVMTVEPGFGGQRFMRNQLAKIEEIRRSYNGDIAVDGGINHETARLAGRAGANVFVAGTYLFSAKDMRELVEKLKKV